jgi:hypothetical protein
MARVFVPGMVAPDAFSDILDPALRNERIRQDIETIITEVFLSSIYHHFHICRHIVKAWD